MILTNVVIQGMNILSMIKWNFDNEEVDHAFEYKPLRSVLVKRELSYTNRMCSMSLAHELKFFLWFSIETKNSLENVLTFITKKSLLLILVDALIQ